MSDAGHYLTGLKVVDAFVIHDLEIPIAAPGELRHLILTGPNGSGKSSVLVGLAASLASFPRQLVGMGTKVLQKPVQLQVEPLGLSQGHDTTQHVLAYLGPRRHFTPTLVSGPNNHVPHAEPLRAMVSESLLQYLVNKRFEQLLAREDGNDEVADAIGGWFESATTALRTLFDNPKLELVFDAKSYVYSFQLGGEHSVTVHQLPDGLRSVLQIWAEIQMRVDLLEDERGQPPRGFVLIDELELHLHAELQERLLPFLTQLFPRLQFIVTTHSPAVASSVSNATVFDLRTREAVSSDELRGQRYGDLFTDWFGIETDFDLETTQELERLQELFKQKPARNSEAGRELAALAARLHKRSHLLGLQVWRELEASRD